MRGFFFLFGFIIMVWGFVAAFNTIEFFFHGKEATATKVKEDYVYVKKCRRCFRERDEDNIQITFQWELDGQSYKATDIVPVDMPFPDNKVKIVYVPLVETFMKAQLASKSRTKGFIRIIGGGIIFLIFGVLSYFEGKRLKKEKEERDEADY